jgi:hypothetical protein
MIRIRLKCKYFVDSIVFFGGLVILVMIGFITNLFTGFGEGYRGFFTFGLSTLNPFLCKTKTKANECDQNKGCKPVRYLTAFLIRR